MMDEENILDDGGTAGAGGTDNPDIDLSTVVDQNPYGDTGDLSDIFKDVPADLLGAAKQLVSQYGTTAVNALKSMFSDGKGGYDWKKITAAGTGLAKLYNTLNPTEQKQGYQGSIPKYDYVRQQTNYTSDPNRRPGSAGREYFTQGQFVPKGTGIAALPPVAVATQAAGPNLSQQAGATVGPQQNMAAGGIAGLSKGRYLRGHTDGMEDKIATTIGGTQPAALSHGEFVVPADVVSHLGNGNSEAGAQRLYGMMDRIRKARTGTAKQGRQIDPNKFMPS